MARCKAADPGAEGPQRLAVTDQRHADVEHVRARHRADPYAGRSRPQAKAGHEEAQFVGRSDGRSWTVVDHLVEYGVPKAVGTVLLLEYLRAVTFYLRGETHRNLGKSLKLGRGRHAGNRRATPAQQR